jgi:acetyl esterase
MTWFTGQYVPTAANGADPRLSPFRANDLTGVCSAYVVTAGFDPLRDEGEAYVRRLRDAGIPTIHRRYDGVVHGFANMVGVSRVSRTATIEVASGFGALLRTGTESGPQP